MSYGLLGLIYSLGNALDAKAAVERSLHESSWCAGVGFSLGPIFDSPTDASRWKDSSASTATKGYNPEAQRLTRVKG